MLLWDRMGCLVYWVLEVKKKWYDSSEQLKKRDEGECFNAQCTRENCQKRGFCLCKMRGQFSQFIARTNGFSEIFREAGSSSYNIRTSFNVPNMA
jgi:hypothetical protein